MLVTMGMNGALAGPSTSSHFELSGVFDLSDLELCKVYCTRYHPTEQAAPCTFEQVP